jgi:nitrogen regulatory protein PII
MQYLVLLVLHDVSRTYEILDAWEEAGVSGVTIIPTTGLGRIREKVMLRDDIPLIPSLHDLLANNYEEMLNRTLFSIVDNEALADRLVEATEAVLGDLDRPHNGIIAVLPVVKVRGLSRAWKSKRHEDSRS